MVRSVKNHKAGGAPKKFPKRSREQKTGYKFHGRVLKRKSAPAEPAPAPKEEKAPDWNEVIPQDAPRAGWAARAAADSDPGIVAENYDIQETADDSAQNEKRKHSENLKNFQLHIKSGW